MQVVATMVISINIRVFILLAFSLIFSEFKLIIVDNKDEKQKINVEPHIKANTKKALCPKEPVKKFACSKQTTNKIKLPIIAPKKELYMNSLSFILFLPLFY